MYSIINKEEQIMKEIIENGPVQANMILYSDFIDYKSGISSIGVNLLREILEIQSILQVVDHDTYTKYYSFIY